MDVLPANCYLFIYLFKYVENSAQNKLGILVLDLLSIVNFWMPSTLRWNKRSESGVLACSALKEQYRQTILLGAEAASENKHYCSNGDKRQKLSRPLPFCCLVVLLHGSKDLIKERMEKRQEHFMPSDLLDSQFESLEEPDNCEMYSVIKVAVDQTVEEIINEILRALKAKYGIRVSIHSTV